MQKQPGNEIFDLTVVVTLTHTGSTRTRMMMMMMRFNVYLTCKCGRVLETVWTNAEPVVGQLGSKPVRE
jgi:hypothetical protein